MHENIPAVDIIVYEQDLFTALCAYSVNYKIPVPAVSSGNKGDAAVIIHRFPGIQKSEVPAVSAGALYLSGAQILVSGRDGQVFFKIGGDRNFSQLVFLSAVPWFLLDKEYKISACVTERCTDYRTAVFRSSREFYTVSCKPCVIIFDCIRVD